MPLHIELNLFFLDAHIVLFQLGLGGMDFTAFLHFNTPTHPQRPHQILKIQTYRLISLYYK